ncbi:MAG: hypothetical protein ACRD5H_10910 [Nitrososphaerales archaeon]
MLAAGIIFYQQRDSLKRTLGSLQGFDLIIAVDGNIIDFPAGDQLSTDGSRELCKEYENVLLLDRSNLTEEAKRTCYLGYSDNLLVLDSDMWIEGNIERFKEKLPTEPGIYCIDGVNFEAQHHPCPLLFIKPQNYEYYGAHMIMKDKRTGQIFRLRGCYERMIPGITVHYDDKLRTQEYMAARAVFKKRQLEHERPTRQRYR